MNFYPLLFIMFCSRFKYQYTIYKATYIYFASKLSTTQHSRNIIIDKTRLHASTELLYYTVLLHCSWLVLLLVWTKRCSFFFFNGSTVYVFESVTERSCHLCITACFKLKPLKHSLLFSASFITIRKWAAFLL